MERDELLENTLESLVQFLRASNPKQGDSVAKANLTPHQFRALVFVLVHDNATTTDLADYVGVHPSVGTGIVQKLVGRGYVTRFEDSQDRRIRRLSLTEHGREFIEGIVGAAREGRRRQLQVLSEEQLAQFGDILETLRAGLPAASK
ncbi:MarR family winged helix-turn-helix transcriptional regulator [Demequina oxidasica]|uniref:MarR family winged helix-turn-helix transcriptional regulator n=1 Tax=Demequina oxidasica TaxID=676199 RepID=UPI0007861123|nr:MarR family transcriptional regulator [Demequina oxidasica]